MRVSRYEAMERELTPVARKVFECVPADDIDAAAVLIDEEINEAGNDTTKLRQLQTLLKELT